MWWIKALRPYVAYRPSVFPITVQAVTRAKSIAIVLDEPETVLVTKSFNCLKVEGVAKSMGNHDCFGLARQSGTEQRTIYIVSWQTDVDKHRHSAVLNDRRDRRGKTAGNSDNFITW